MFKLEALDLFPFIETLWNLCSFRYDICIFSHHCMSTKITEAGCFLRFFFPGSKFFLFVEKQKHKDPLKPWKLSFLTYQHLTLHLNHSI